MERYKYRRLELVFVGVCLFYINSGNGYQLQSEWRRVHLPLSQNGGENVRQTDSTIISSTFLRNQRRRRRRKQSTIYSPDSRTFPIVADFSTSMQRPVIWNKYQQTNPLTIHDKLLLAFSGVLVALAVLYSIAMFDEPIPYTSWNNLLEHIQAACQNTWDAIAPLGISDIVAVLVGESTAAAVAALASTLIILSLKFRSFVPVSAVKSSSSVVADGDYLLAKAATVQVLMSIGIPPYISKIGSNLLGTLSYGIVKVGINRRDQLAQEDRSPLLPVEDLLVEQQKQEGIELGNQFSTFNSNNSSTKSFINNNENTDEILPPQTEKEYSMDIIVEAFSDIVKWLQYDVISSHYGGTMSLYGQPFGAGFDAAVFGAISCFTAQMYCDMLRKHFYLSGTKVHDSIMQRSYNDWISIYVSQALYGAALFVTHEAVQIPAQWLLNAFISGGVDNCIGSHDYTGCVETFVELYPLDDTPEEEIYSRITPAFDTFKQFLISNGFPLSF
jgi:hypothetical protein